MLRKVLGSVACLVVGGYYFVTDKFVEDVVVGGFSNASGNFSLYMDKHPDGTVFVSLWDDQGSTYAVLDWFRPTDQLAFDCATQDKCMVVQKVDAETNQISGFQLSMPSNGQALSTRQFQSSTNHNFVKFSYEIPAEQLAGYQENNQAVMAWLE